MLLTVPSESRCGTSCGIEQVKGRARRVAGVRFCCKPATFKSALGRTRTCGLLIRSQPPPIAIARHPPSQTAILQGFLSSI
jgi:hypothetical protein